MKALTPHKHIAKLGSVFIYKSVFMYKFGSGLVHLNTANDD